MVSTLIAVASALGYLAGFTLSVRIFFTRWRPYRLPLACDYSSHRKISDHIWDCYTRPGSADTRGEAVLYSVLVSAMWPASLLLLGFGHIVAGTAPDFPEEREAKIRQLEAENERLRRQQEGRLS